MAASGGGAYDSALINCAVTGNSAQTNQNSPNPSFPYYSNGQPGIGGGIYLCSAVNCIIAGNRAFEGGGVFEATGLKNCTIINNSASFFGGVYLNGSNLSPYTYNYASNCLIYFNTADTNANFGATNLFADHCCTFPMPTGGVGNITNNPTLVDAAGGDFHLQALSPCINSGGNAIVTYGTDYDGKPRIVGGTVDIGAYEYQTPSSVLSYAWAQQYGLTTDGSADFVDTDGDGMNNYQEFIAGTNPTNTASALVMSSAVPLSTPSRVMVKWKSVNTRNYYLLRSTDLGAQPGFTVIQSNIVGQNGTTIFFDYTATNGGPYFYRVGVQ
ncbi:MAG: thrombospondin type 3 repeat-containing protein [Verrucomicrobiota bacterium]